MELAEQHAVAEQIVHAESIPMDELGCLEMQKQQSVDMHFERRKNALHEQLATASTEERSDRRANKQKLLLEEDRLLGNESQGKLEAQQLKFAIKTGELTARCVEELHI